MEHGCPDSPTLSPSQSAEASRPAEQRQEEQRQEEQPVRWWAKIGPASEPAPPQAEESLSSPAASASQTAPACPPPPRQAATLQSSYPTLCSPSNSLAPAA